MRFVVPPCDCIGDDISTQCAQAKSQLYLRTFFIFILVAPSRGRFGAGAGPGHEAWFLGKAGDPVVFDMPLAYNATRLKSRVNYIITHGSGPESAQNHRFPLGRRQSGLSPGTPRGRGGATPLDPQTQLYLMTFFIFILSAPSRGRVRTVIFF